MITDGFSDYLGIKIIEVKEGYAKAMMEIKDYHLNLHNTVHGGAIFSLADSAFAIASNSYPDIKAVALQVNIQFLNSVKEGTLFAEARENFKNEKIGSYTIKVFNSDKIVSIFDGIVYRKKL